MRGGWHCSVGITTVCRSGVRIQVEAKLFTPSRPSSLLYNGYLIFSGGKAAGSWR